MTTENTPRVTQADRDAAWPFRPGCYKDDRLTREKWDDGVYDGGAPCIQAFARHAHEAREAAEAAAKAREAELVEALELLRSYGCPHCNGDCGSANPPVMTCPMDVAGKALARHKAGMEGGV